MDRMSKYPPVYPQGTLLGEMSLTTWLDFQNDFYGRFINPRGGSRIVGSNFGLPPDVVYYSTDGTLNYYERYATIFPLSNPITIGLPSPRFVGQTHGIKGSTNVDTFNVTIDGNGNNIDGTPSYVLSNPYESVLVRWNGNEWEVI